MPKEQKENKECCICGKKAECKCRYCGNDYCLKHYESVVCTGNCCSSNEKDYDYEG